MEGGFNALVRKAQLIGQSIHSDEMIVDANFWNACNSEWGKGFGYRKRINLHTQIWFEKANVGNADARVIQLVLDSWEETITTVRNLIDQD